MYTVNAFLIWGGGYFAAHGALDYSGGYVIHLAAGISGFVAAAVIGPRLQRDREVDAPNNLLMVAAGAGLLWLGWNGFNGGDSYYAGANASAAVLNTNLCTAVAMLVWIAWDYIFRDKPSLIGSVNGMITGLVCDHARPPVSSTAGVRSRSASSPRRSCGWRSGSSAARRCSDTSTTRWG